VNPTTIPESPTQSATADGADLVGELLQIDPRTLILGANTRHDIQLDRYFVRDIADRGVREPITVQRRGDGALVVRKGQRRTLAAIQAGLPLVRVLLEPAPEPEDSDTAGQIDCIIDQLGENQHRAALTEADEVRAHQQLLDLGLTAGQIARRTHTPTTRVRITTTVARSQLASAIIAQYDLTLDQAAVIAEFDTGAEADTEAVTLLRVTAQTDPDRFAHVAQRLRDDRDDARLIEQRTTELTTAGVRVIDADTDGAVSLQGLRPTTTDLSGTALTEDTHASCPGHVASVEIHRSWDGTHTVRTTYLCTDPDTHGHAPRWDSALSGGGASRQPGPMSDADKDQRRQVIANNKAWDSATTVRRDWLRHFLTRKSAPKDAAQFIALTLCTGSLDVRKAMESGHSTACDLLGLPAQQSYPGTPGPIAEAAANTTAARATMLSLAVLLGGFEAGATRNSWRSPTIDTRIYLHALHTWGYGLSEVEHLVLTPEGQDADASPDDEDTGETAA
jgi:ParB family transcriptional regulator, chromosome partitioning protein